MGAGFILIFISWMGASLWDPWSQVYLFFSVLIIELFHKYILCDILPFLDFGSQGVFVGLRAEITIYPIVHA